MGGRGRGGDGALNGHVQTGHVATARACPVCVCVLDEGAGRGRGQGREKSLWARMLNYSRAPTAADAEVPLAASCRRRRSRPSRRRSQGHEGPLGSPSGSSEASASSWEGRSAVAPSGRARSEITGTKKALCRSYVHALFTFNRGSVSSSPPPAASPPGDGLGVTRQFISREGAREGTAGGVGTRHTTERWHCCHERSSHSFALNKTTGLGGSPLAGASAPA